MRLITFLLLTSVLSISFSVRGQGYKVISKEKLEVQGMFPVFDPYSNSLLLSGPGFKGLRLLNLENGSEVVISDEIGAGYAPVVLPSVIRYKTGTKENGEYLRFDRSTQAPARTETEDLIVEVESDLTGIILKQGENTVSKVSPIKGDYLNVSLSPDKSKILFRISGRGAYVTNLEGQILYELGNMEFPSWLDNTTVVSTRTIDDGHQYLSSNLFLTDLETGNKVEIVSDKEIIALFPSSDPDRKRIAFHTPEGYVYLIQLVAE